MESKTQLLYYPAQLFALPVRTHRFLDTTHMQRLQVSTGHVSIAQNSDATNSCLNFLRVLIFQLRSPKDYHKLNMVRFFCSFTLVHTYKCDRESERNPPEVSQEVGKR